MSTNNNSTQNGRIVWIGLLAVLAVAFLAVGAFMWGSRLNADTAQANANITSAASASRYGSSLGVSAVRAADAAISSGRSLRGVAAVRAIDLAEIAPTSLRIGPKTQALSSLELRRARALTSAVQANDASAARYVAMGAAYNARAATDTLRARNADDARYAAMDAAYGAKTATDARRARDADTARYTAMNVFYGAKD